MQFLAQIKILVGKAKLGLGRKIGSNIEQMNVTKFVIRIHNVRIRNSRRDVSHDGLASKFHTVQHTEPSKGLNERSFQENHVSKNF